MRESYNRGTPPISSFHLITSSLLALGLMHGLNNLINNTWIRKRRSITKLILLTSQNLPQDSPHDLTRSRLWQVWYWEDCLGCGEGTDRFPDLQDQILLELIVDLVAVLDGDEGVDGLSCEFVVDTDDSSFADGLVLDEGGFDFGCGQTMAGNVHDVVDTAADPVVSLVISCCTVSSEVIAFVDVQVGVHVSLVSTPDGAGHGWPGLLEGEHTLDVVALDLFAGYGVDNGGLDAEEGERCRARLGWGYTTHWRNDVGASLCLPVCLENC